MGILHQCQRNDGASILVARPIASYSLGQGHQVWRFLAFFLTFSTRVLHPLFLPTIEGGMPAPFQIGFIAVGFGSSGKKKTWKLSFFL
jgi:hypothetical protein